MCCAVVCISHIIKTLRSYKVTGDREPVLAENRRAAYQIVSKWGLLKHLRCCIKLLDTEKKMSLIWMELGLWLFVILNIQSLLCSGLFRVTEELQSTGRRSYTHTHTHIYTHISAYKSPESHVFGTGKKENKGGTCKHQRVILKHKHISHFCVI